MSKFIHPVLFALALALSAAVLLFSDRNPFELALLDHFSGAAARQGASSEQSKVLVVGVDEAFVRQLDRPLSLIHAELAEVLLAASGAGALAIGLDFVLPEKRFDQLQLKGAPLDFHRQLLRGLLQASARTPLIAAKIWDPDKAAFRPVHVDFLAVLNRQAGEFQAHASAMLCNHSDQRVRALPSANCQPDGTDHYFAAELVRAAGFPVQPRGWINYGTVGAWPYLPIGEVLQRIQAGDQAWLQARFAGRIVLVGSVLNDMDLHHTPLPIAAWAEQGTRVPGVLVHAEIAQTHLAQAELQWPSTAFLLGLSALSMLAFARPVAWRIGLGVGVLAVVGAAAFLLLPLNAYFPCVSLTLAVLLVLFIRSLGDGALGLQERLRLRRAFSGAVSPQVLDNILQGQLQSGEAGKRVNVCVLFSDIRGFTTLSEGLPPEVVVALLNRYFDAMTAVVHAHGGTVDKFIGDGMMAFFGAPNALPNAEKQAVDAARAMVQALGALNQAWARDGLPPIGIGVGLHAGPALVGFVGGQNRYEYTAIGDTVNVAARVEGLCKNLARPILVTGAVKQAIDADPTCAVQFESLGKQSLKGRSDMDIFGVI